MLETLDQIILSENVVENFYKHYSTKEFFSWINEILPEIQNCKDLKQDNPWHIFNCLDHILHSVEEMNKITQNLDTSTKRKLGYTMFLHDIGKPACYIRRYSKLYKREVDSFFNHNIESVKIANRVLADFKFNSQEIKEIKSLVHYHDLFMSLTLEEDGNKYHRKLDSSVIKEQIDIFDKIGNGKQLMQELIWVGMSDNLAQNPKMTKNSLCLINYMNDMLNTTNFSEVSMN